MHDAQTAPDPHRLPVTVTPRHYRLFVAPDFAEGSFSGRVEIEVDVPEPVDQIVLHSKGLRITEASVEDSAVGHRVDEATDRLTLQAAPEVGSRSRISLGFEGQFDPHLVGFYVSQFTGDDGRQHELATTQFQATHARKAFPCWDEPSYKATFEISIRVPAGMEAVSNAAETSRDPLDDGGHIAHFGPTITMSTYLVAWVVGPLDFSETRIVSGTPIRVVSRPGLVSMSGFALDAAEFALSYFADYFGLPYPGDKVDLIAVPDFAFGAMENLGCITFREALLMVDPAVTTQTEMQRAVDVINHELAHMWFGDLVTMQWWNGIWLNEAFATFMEMKCTDAYRPDWERWADFGLSRTAAFATDALAATRPIEYQVRTPEESEGMFDILTYEKGAAVVRMLEQHLGEDAFRNGLRSYMEQYAYGNTETTDLWDALEASTGRPVRNMMDGWIFQGGFPRITVSVDGGAVSLSQQRCVAAGGGEQPEPQQWMVPLRYRISDGASITTGSLVLEDTPITLDLDSEDSWIIINAEGASFVRVSYPPVLLDRLAGLDGVELSEVERYALVDDAWADVLAGDMTTTAFLNLLEAMASETSRSVWLRIIAGLDALSRLVAAEAAAGFQSIAHDIVSPMLANVGLTPVQDETERDRQLRADLIKAMGTIAEDPDVQYECQRTVSVGRRDPALVDPALMSAAIAVTAHVGDNTDFDDFRRGFAESGSPQEQLRYLYALAEFPTDALVGRLRTMVLDGEVRTQNVAFALRAALRNRQAGESTWEFIKAHWSTLVDRLPSSSISRMLEGVTALSTDDLVADVGRFLDAHPLPQADLTVRQIREQQRVNAALRAREAARLTAFVAD